MRKIGILVAFGGLGATLVAACSAESESPPDTPQGTTTEAPDGGCGDGCDGGPDGEPDSAPPDACETATEPTTTCPCETPGEQVYCGKVYVKIGEQTACGPGYMACDANLIWGECILNNAAEPPQT